MHEKEVDYGNTMFKQASGSKGNSTFIVEKTTDILIDCGISKRNS